MMNANTRAKETRPRRQPSFRRPLIVVGLLLTVSLLRAACLTDRSYTFTASEHPIEVMGNGDGRWFYYMPARVEGGTAQFAATVRGELIGQGFVEDTGNRPWYRFVKGGREVIVCCHNEIATNDCLLEASILHETPCKGDGIQPTVVWVRQTGADPIGVACFQVEKLVFRW